MKQLSVRSLRSALALAACVTLFAGNVAGQERVISPDSTLAVRLPASFQPVMLHEEAELQFADSATQSFFMVLLEGKQDMVGWNLTRHSMITLGQMLTRLDSPEVTGPQALTIGGYPAVQYQVTGVTQGVRLGYLHTTIDGPTSFAQVVAWTAGSRWDANRQLLRDITASIQLPNATSAISTDVHHIVAGTWAWESDAAPCSGLKQTFVVADDRKSMKIHHSEPIESADGKTTSVTNYVVERSSPLMLHTYIPDETRRTDTGEPVKWDLVVVARNRITWHRADWPQGAFTGMLRRCDAK